MADEPAIRRLFHLELLRFFAERTGWNLESDGEHLAIWTRRLEELTGFYVRFFGAMAGPPYRSARRPFESCFLSFASGARLELMRLPVLPPSGGPDPRVGLAHLAISVGSAAEVDGATTVRKFFWITLPNLRPVTTVLLLLGVIWSFNDFTLVFVMTRGGPINASMVLPVLVREFSFVSFDLGRGSTLSVLVFGLLLLLSFLYLRVLSRRETA